MMDTKEEDSNSLLSEISSHEQMSDHRAWESAWVCSIPGGPEITEQSVVYHVCLVENTAKFKFICGCLHAIYASFTLSCFTRI